MANKKSHNTLDARREALLQQALSDPQVAATVSTFNALSGFLSPPQLVSTAEVRFDTKLGS